MKNHDVELARINADKPEDDDVLRKKLWLTIAKHVVQDNKDIKTALEFLKQSNLLKIEDILPFFPDFVLIDDFKVKKKKNHVCLSQLSKQKAAIKIGRNLYSFRKIQ